MTKTRLSFSRADKYGTCGERYRLSYIEQVPEIPSLALLGGSAFHEWAHDYERYRIETGDKFPHRFAQYFEDQLAKAEFESGLKREQFKTSGRKTKALPNKEDLDYWTDELGPWMCAAFGKFDWEGWTVATDLPPDGKGNTIGLEYHIETEGFQGFADRIDQDSNGNLRVVDYKAGQRIYPSIQTELYMMAGQRAGMRLVYGGYYHARKAELTYKPVRWNHDTFDEYLALSRRGIDSQFYLPNPGEHCGWCSVSAHCQFSA